MRWLVLFAPHGKNIANNECCMFQWLSSGFSRVSLIVLHWFPRFFKDDLFFAISMVSAKIGQDGWLCIVMDYCEGGDLAGKIKSARWAEPLQRCS